MQHSLKKKLEFLIFKGNICSMLGTIRDKHMKKILWGMIAVIVPAFVLWGGASALKDRKKGVIGYIDGKKITELTYNEHLKMARTILLLTSNNESKIERKDVESSAIDFMTLLWKADKEKIEVDDKEVILYVKKIFFPEGKFDKTMYEINLKSLSQRFNLGISVRDFEEYIRNFLKINKLFSLNTNSEVTEEELKKMYFLNTQKAKISYLGIPYKNFEKKDDISLEEITEFYEKNNDLFKVEPKININYILVEKNNNLKDEIIKKADTTNSLQELSEEFSLPITETGLVGLNEPIKDIGWQPEINKMAFALEKNKIGPIISSDKGTLFIEKKESKDAYIPDLKEIESEVKEKMIKESAKISAKEHVDELLKNLLNGTTNFTDIAKQEEIEIKEPPEFKYYDYIDGIGLDEKISEIVFSLEKNQFYPETLLLHNGAYIIRLNDKTAFDEKDYQEKSKVYSAYIKQNKEISERMKFMSEIRIESKIKTFSILR